MLLLSLLLFVYGGGLRKQGYCQGSTICNLHEGKEKADTDVISSTVFNKFVITSQ